MASVWRVSLLSWRRVKLVPQFIVQVIEFEQVIHQRPRQQVADLIISHGNSNVAVLLTFSLAAMKMTLTTVIYGLLLGSSVFIRANPNYGYNSGGYYSSGQQFSRPNSFNQLSQRQVIEHLRVSLKFVIDGCN